MNYKKINNLVGWIVCLIASGVYLKTKEFSGSFWDCGEFVSAAKNLEVVHSPGAPFFLLLGRIFTLFVSDANAAKAVNSLSALSSGFTILFLFWSITHFAKRAFEKKGWLIEGANMWAIMAAGVVGGLAYTFSDTFWFSAVEGEVYALSSFLTALVFWAILKWEENLSDKTNPTNQKMADRWIIFIAYIMGLSIGVHLLNLLAIPAIFVMYYFHKYTVSRNGTIIAFILGCVITGLVQFGIIQGIPILASKFDLLFVNSFGMPFNSGAFACFVCLIALFVFLIVWAKKTGHYKTYIGSYCTLFILIGYSTFLQVLIRSNADVPIDMTNPDNTLSLVKYLQREQYGNTPLLFGVNYNIMSKYPGGQGLKTTEGAMDYKKGEKKYEEIGLKQGEYDFDFENKMFFPRVWDYNDPRHVQYYKSYLNLGDGQEPSFIDNIYFFLSYQCNQMYWRYFLWNFVGRQNDTQNIQGEPENGNWISGIGFVDRIFGRGDTDKLPVGVKDSPARNELYGLPFILGLLGLYFHYKSDKRNTFIVFLLFFFTGFAIVIYLNNVPLQPRERDYAYVGSMYAFAIWIGLGVLQIYELLKNKMGAMPSLATAGLVTFLAVPTIMCAKEWDDHDRSNKKLPPDTAHNFLETCEKNAILFTEGDNDTYPLWYAQEVEGKRRDVRIVNLSLLGIDWYINQLNYKINDAPAVPMAWKEDQYQGTKRNYVVFDENKDVVGKSIDLNVVLDYVNDDSKAQVVSEKGDKLNFIPTKSVFINLGGDSSTGGGIIEFTLPLNKQGDALYKPDLAILNILAKNLGKRPIYFANTIDPKHYEGLYPYCEQEGILFKVGNKNSGVTQVGMPTPINAQKSYDLFTKVYKFGGAERNDVFFDQTNRRMMNVFRTSAARIADGLMEKGKNKEALQVLDKCTKSMTEKSYPYALNDEERNMLFLADSYLRAGDKTKSKYIIDKLFDYVRAEISYSNTISAAAKEVKKQEIGNALNMLGFSIQGAQRVGDSTLANEYQKKIMDLMQVGGIQLNNTPQ